MSRKEDRNKTQDSLTRIAIVNSDRCKPKRCRQECKKSCPVVRMGKPFDFSSLVCFAFAQNRLLYFFHRVQVCGLLILRKALY